jgi:hypothetical protein
MKAIVNVETDRVMRSQAERIQNHALYGELFHDPFPNNFSFICINRRHDLQQSKNNNADALKKLNIANYNLHKFCERFMPDVPWKNSDVAEKVHEVNTKWGETITAGNSFLCYDYANFVIHSMSDSGFPFLQTLTSDRFKVIVDAFLSLDYRWKSFVKISAFVQNDRTYSQLHQLIERLHKNPELFHYVERIELQKEFFPGDVKKITTDPALSLILDRNVVSTKSNPIIKKIAALLSEIYQSPVESDNATNFLHFLYKDIAASQGFKAYKKFLQLAGCIDHVYDSGGNYAYIKP